MLVTHDITIVYYSIYIFIILPTGLGGGKLPQLMCVFPTADSFPIGLTEKEAPGYGLWAQVMRTQPFSRLLSLPSFRIHNISSINVTVARTAIEKHQTLLN